MTELQRAVHERKLAEAAVEVALGQLMVAERVTKSPSEIHASLRALVDALIKSADATRQLALVLAVDGDAVVAGAELDAVIPPIIEHVDDTALDYAPHMGYNACWKKVEGEPGNCRMPEHHEGPCAPS